MKSLTISTILLTMTFSSIALFPIITKGTSATNFSVKSDSFIKAPPRHAVDAVFVLDTTGSMSGLIDTAKEKIWAIATTLSSAQQQPDIRIGLVGFRDRGDDYVTRTIDLSDDLDSVYAALMDFEAAGGGDGPESVNQALADAVHRMSWQPNGSRYQAIFLFGDAPPHMDYQNEIQYEQTIKQAAEKNIVINAIQCGNNIQTKKFWQEIAYLGQGQYFQVEQSGGALAIETPVDAELARLSSELDDTRVYYGDAELRAKMHDKVAATEKLNAEASVASLARRSVFNASTAGRKNRLGENELVDAISSGRVSIDELEEQDLPPEMKSLDASAQKAKIKELAKQRKKLEAKIKSLTEQRQAYINNEMAHSENPTDSLESKLYEAVKQQGLAAGLIYQKGPDY